MWDLRIQTGDGNVYRKKFRFRIVRWIYYQWVKRMGFSFVSKTGSKIWYKNVVSINRRKR